MERGFLRKSDGIQVIKIAINYFIAKNFEFKVNVLSKLTSAIPSQIERTVYFENMPIPSIVE